MSEETKTLDELSELEKLQLYRQISNEIQRLHNLLQKAQQEFAIVNQAIEDDAK